MYFVFIFVSVLPFVRGQIISPPNANCDYSQNVQVGTTYYVYSPNYRQNYTRGTQCRWIAHCPSGYNCVLNCNDVNLPQTLRCSGDSLLISKSGDPYLSGAERYCGQGALPAIVSTKQSISVLLNTIALSPGGRFSCILTAQPVKSTDNNTCNCGYKKTNRIVGGTETGVNEYTMLAGIVDVRIFQIKCGATIIANRYTLTAAHCVINLSPTNTALVVGEHDVTKGDSPATRGYLIEKFISHQNYSTTTQDNDIAIVRTMLPMEFNDRVGPVCLPFKFANVDLTGKTVTLLGWGTLFPGGPTSNVPRKVDVQVMNQALCRTAASPSLVTARQICTYTPGKDACQDDSGGPMIYTDPATGLLFQPGVISNGRFCAQAGQPGINTRVTEYLPWIKANTPGVVYCTK